MIEDRVSEGGPEAITKEAVEGRKRQLPILQHALEIAISEVRREELIKIKTADDVTGLLRIMTTNKREFARALETLNFIQPTDVLAWAKIVLAEKGIAIKNPPAEKEPGR